MSDYEKHAVNTMRDKINHTQGRRYIEVHFSVANEDCPPVVLELFEDLCPQTCANFLQLSRANYDHTKDDKAGVISYKDSEIHRIVPGMFIQGGRIKGVEQGKASAFGQEFEDESFHMKHQEIGMLGMCKRGGLKHTNES